MTVVTSSDTLGFDFDYFDFSTVYDGVRFTRSSTLFRVDYDDGTRDEFRGTGFRYSSLGEPISGVVTSYAAFDGSTRVASIEGGRLDVADIRAAALTSSTTDDFALIQDVLSRADRFIGGAKADSFQSFGGNDALNGFGGNDTLFGGDGADLIYGDLGADSLSGDAGNDTLLGGAGGDRLIGGAGADTATYASAKAAVLASLGSARSNSGDARGDVYSSIENLIGSRFNDALGGDGAANRLSGGAGNDRLNGGLGQDILEGGAGADTFSFKNAPSATNIDIITDFRPLDDTIALSRAAFDRFAPLGDLAKAAFWTGARAHDASDRIIYNEDTGRLYFDSDGTGDDRAVLFAILKKGLALTAADFDVI
ncbi:calcium-binding protein [Hansschlegelia sp. KR7-227]|uniref:calcium-binding protein n=1 Tax=Hansschlegelia sp. KR7-227 TaxID=3400914 RepID=UPI003BFD7C60